VLCVASPSFSLFSTNYPTPFSVPFNILPLTSRCSSYSGPLPLLSLCDPPHVNDAHRNKIQIPPTTPTLVTSEIAPLSSGGGSAVGSTRAGLLL
jgi:hypothetical protein